MRCIWSGRSVARKPSDQLLPYFDKLLASSEESDKSLEMRFEKLSHFNSSTIGTLIMLIQEARKKKVRLALVYDASLKWQRLSFEALRMFEKGDNLFELRTV